jgi:branched-chain amino acid aminotransferase
VKVWLNGVLCDEREARVSPFDHGLLTGDGVFETLRVYEGVPFALRRHLLRLGRSAEGLKLPLLPAADLSRACAAVVAANRIGDGRLRITVTGGAGPLGSERGGGDPTTVVAAAPLSPWPPSVDVVVVPWPRNERGAIAGLKTISYAENVVALAHARAQGAGEAVFPNLAGRLCEGTGTNVFVGLGGRLLTPPLVSGCLAGVTRELLLEAGAAEEDDLPVHALAEADEAFLTSSTREVHPVRAVDGRPIPRCPGPLTRRAASAFAEILAAGMDP